MLSDLPAIDNLLHRLRSVSEQMPRPGREWEDRPYFEPPAAEEDVAAFEQAAGFRLPDDVREFLSRTDAVVGMSIHNGYWIGGIRKLASLVGAEGLAREMNGELLAPIASDGGGNWFMFSESGAIWRLNREAARLSPVARSFNEFLKLVVADWEAYVDDRPEWKYLE